MQTLTIDILNAHAEKFIADLEHMQLIRVRKEGAPTSSVINWAGSFKSPKASLNGNDRNEKRSNRK